MGRLRQCGKHIALFMKPAPLLSGIREHLAQRSPEPQGTVPDGQVRGRHAAAPARPQQVGPRFGRFAVAIGQGDELFTAVGPHTDHHQQAQFLLLKPDFEVDSVDPEVDIIAGDVAVFEGRGFLLPLAGQPGDRGRRQPCTRAEKLLECRPEIPRRQPVQVQQRQHRADLRTLACPRRDDLRREPLTFTSFRVDPLVVDPRCPHRHRTSSGHHLPLVVVAVTHHQPTTVLIDLIGELIDIDSDLGLQGCGEHLPGPVAHDLIEDRPVIVVGLVGTIRGVDYREHEACLSASAATLT